VKPQNPDEEEEPDIIFGSGFAIASYGWQIEYEMDGVNFNDKGRDWLAVEKQNGTWRVVWRLLVQAPSRTRLLLGRNRRSFPHALPSLFINHGLDW
jgi:hypothetical protein